VELNSLAQKWKGPILSRVFLLLAACLVSLLAAEITVRLLFRYNTPDTLDAASLKYKPSIFSRHLFRVNQEVYLGTGWDRRGGQHDSGRLVRINSHGFRGDEFPLEKPTESQRVIVIGGSAVFDIHASHGNDWPHLTQQDLRESGWANAEIINAGIPAHATFDALGRLYSSLWLLSPDYIVLNNAWNDIKYFTRLSPEQPLSEIYSPYMENSDPLRNYRGPVDRVLCASQLYVKLRTRYWLWKTKRGSEGAVLESNSSNYLSEFAKDQYESTIRSFVLVARVFGIEPILMTQPTLVQSDNTEDDKSRIGLDFQDLNHDQLEQAFTFCNATVRKIASEMQVTLVDADARLSGRSEFFRDHVHTTAAGSKELAELLAGALEQAFEAHEEMGIASETQ